MDGLHGNAYDGRGYETHGTEGGTGEGAGESGRLEDTLLQASYAYHVTCGYPVHWQHLSAHQDKEVPDDHFVHVRGEWFDAPGGVRG